jgi:DNA gyrase subunit A
MADEPMGDDDVELLRARVRLQIVEALMRALDLGWELHEAIASSADRGEARARLTASPFGFADIEAEHVLDLQFSRGTKQARSFLEEEAVQLREQLGQ